MKNKLQKNQTIKTTRELDYTKTGGPLIPKGTKATVLKKCHDGSMWVQFDDASGIGRRNESPNDFDAMTPYQMAVAELAGGVQDAMTDGHDKESAIDLMIEGLEDDIRDYLAKHQN